jgi:ABC-type transport system involved in multi-copper enzyme maturation permease subunit
MKRLLAWAGAGDWVNAVAIKEFRQAVQSRWVIAVLMLFLLIDVFIVGGYLALSPDAATSTRGGRDTFTGLLVILMITSIGFVPLYTGIRLSLERNDANIDLLFITTIRPGAIVRGKYLSAMGLTLLIFSTCMPFMVLTYLLGGVDPPDTQPVR